ncbi:hypothetical protein PVK06_047095 [Gossypium arboreum]|uniref:Uncharacterized protein n=1 Tax=Gossypium arboreum TaxID=29729 RepID=A0ABR0MCH6_GOSAR|nr:hypothetical protein PVK06_047095 [Gossypium arboreum]
MDETDYMRFNDKMGFDDEIYNEGVHEEWEIMENKKLFMIEMSQCRNEASTYQWSNEQGTNIVEHPYEFIDNLYKALEEDHDMPKHSNKPSSDSCGIPSCETTRTNNSEILSHMSNMMV